MRNADVWGWECFGGFMALDLTFLCVPSKTTTTRALHIIVVAYWLMTLQYNTYTGTRTQ